MIPKVDCCVGGSPKGALRRATILDGRVKHSIPDPSCSQGRRRHYVSVVKVEMENGE